MVSNQLQPFNSSLSQPKKRKNGNVNHLQRKQNKNRKLPSANIPLQYRRRRRKAKNKRMADNSDANKNNTIDSLTNLNCQNFITYTVRNGPGKVIGLILAFVLSYLVHRLLRPFSQPRIASDIVVSLSFLQRM